MTSAVQIYMYIYECVCYYGLVVIVYCRESLVNIKLSSLAMYDVSFILVQVLVPSRPYFVLVNSWFFCL